MKIWKYLIVIEFLLSSPQGVTHVANFSSCLHKINTFFIHLNIGRPTSINLCDLHPKMFIYPDINLFSQNFLNRNV